MEVIRVSANSTVSAVAEAITSVILEYHQAEVQAIGEDAANQAIQALDLAICSLKDNGISVTPETRFSEVTVDDKTSTAVKVMVRQNSSPGFTPRDLTASPATAKLPRV